MLQSISSSSERRTLRSSHALGALLIGVVAIWGTPNTSPAADLLVVDRLSNSVFRYNASGTLLNTVVDHSPELNQPTGIGMSPDVSHLYVSSSQNNHVLQYDYNPATGAATNPSIFADASDGLEFPNDIRFSPDGSTIYVANLNGGVSRFHPDGTSAGTKLMLPSTSGEGSTQTSSLAFTATGELLAGAFGDAGGAGGGVAISNPSVSAFPGFLVTPSPALTGATGLMIHDSHVYVSGMFTASIRRFVLSTGQIDPAWGVSGVAFPQDLVEAPDGNGFLAGILGFANGSGNISRYAFDGTFLSTFASPSANGFTEATAFVVVPNLLIGDFNNNGIVDAADFVVWRNASPFATLPNDDTPGVVDASDYADWRANFGKSSAATSAALSTNLVPEPASILLLFTAILLSSLVRQQN